ncbi:MAG: transposase [Phycisphaerales bacterium]
MSRSIRQTPGGVVFHVLNRRVMRLPLFEDRGDYEAFERVLGEAMERAMAPQLFAYCLMPNHWHLLVRPRASGDLSRWMQWLTVTHTHRWHAHRRSAGAGPLYQGRFRSFPVQADGHFLTVARYVEANPRRAGLVSARAGAEAWRWGSLGVRRAGPDEMRAILSDWPVARPRDWVRRVNQSPTPAETDAVRRCVARGSPFGAAPWSARTAERLGLEQTLRPRGRPRRAPARSKKSS